MTDPTVLVQAVVSGLLMGGVYALIAAGLTLILGVMKVVNFAHGEFLMVGMYATFFLVTGLGLDPYVSVVITVPALFLFGALIYIFVLRPVLNSSMASQILALLGVSLFLQNAALLAFTGNYRSVSTSYAQTKFELGGILFSLPLMIAFGVSVGITLLLYWLIKSTEMGRWIRAASDNYDAARLMGINVNRVFLVTFAVGTALLGVAGPMLAPIYYTSPDIGLVFIFGAFAVVILGGLGSFVGALIGGLIIGVADSVGGLFMPGSTGPMLSFIIMIVVLLFRPQGLLGGKKL